MLKGWSEMIYIHQLRYITENPQRIITVEFNRVQCIDL